MQVNRSGTPGSNLAFFVSGSCLASNLVARHEHGMTPSRTRYDAAPFSAFENPVVKSIYFFNFKEQQLLTMARQINMELEGTIGDLIFYERYGEFLIRTVQEQAEGSKRSAQNFGLASSRAKLIRSLLAPLIPNPKDKDMQNRLTVAIRKYFAAQDNQEAFSPDENALAAFRFVPGSGLKECVRFPFSLTALADGRIRFEIPEINPRELISAPAGSSHAELIVMAASFNPDSSDYFAGSPEISSIPYIDSMQSAIRLVLDTGAGEGSIILVAAALRYWNNTKQINKTGFMPVEIVAVFE